MGIKSRYAPGYESVAPLLKRFVENDVPPEAEVIYRGRNTVSVCGHDGVRLNFKQFKTPILINRLAYGCLRKSKAVRAFENATRLQAWGINTPTPVAVAEERRGPMLYRSVFVSLQADGYTDCRHIEHEPDFERQAEYIADLILKLQRAGIVMLDFSPGNVMRRRRPDGGIDLCLVDINRMDFGVRSQRRLDHMFGAFVETAEAVAVIGRAYARLAGIDERQGAERAVATFERVQRHLIRKKRFKNFFKKLFN
ncbi:MAG: lipopolysaccharide kinase InaA family protein [Bacteroidales bacterium]|nr:lipopolysaccharide kinase InaA family protein [Bacteroidales bacterium]